MTKLKEHIQKNGKGFAQYILPFLYSYITGLIGIFYAFRFNQFVALIISHSKKEIDVADVYAWNSTSFIAMLIWGIILIVIILLTQYLCAKEIKVRWLPRSFVVIVILQAIAYLGTMLYIGQYT